MELEVIFKDSSKPKRFENADDLYTKGKFCCIRVGDMIIKYPLRNIFSIVHPHGFHWGSQKHLKEIKKGKNK